MSQALDKEKSITYSSYLAIDELIALQRPESEEHDEMLFIIIHQAYELWFKQLLHEAEHLAGLLKNGKVAKAPHTLKRMLSILKTIVSQIDILETMTPLEFNSFRDRLGSSSGFQSHQFRELEFYLGYKRETILKHHAEGSLGRRQLTKRFEETTLWDAFLELLILHGYPISLRDDVTQRLEASEEVQQTLIEIYRTNDSLASLCESLLDFDEGMQEWRYRHVKMVERTIGHKMGTGGSAGVDYLKSTLQPLFPDLWEIRSKL